MRTLLATLALLLVLTGSARAADPGQIEHFTLGTGNDQYTYIVYVPTTYKPATPAPLVVMTHGCQTTADQQMRANLYNDIAEREGLIVLYPDITPHHVAQPGPLNRCWQFFNSASWHRGSGDANAIATMTKNVMARWNVDSERVYMVGMSAGSFMTSIMSAAYPDLFAAVAINAGGAYADPLCIVGQPITRPVEDSAAAAFAEEGPRARVVPRMVSGGDVDSGITPACADKAFFQGLRTNNLVLSGTQDGPLSLNPAAVREDVEPGRYRSTVSTYLDPDGCEIGERWLIHGMNHFWPGGSTDPDPKGPNGAELTWAFLKRYTKSTTSLPCAEAPHPAAAPTRCAARWRSLALPRGATRVRATVNGRRATTRAGRQRVRVRLAAGRRLPTTVTVRGRTKRGAPFTRTLRLTRC